MKSINRLRAYMQGHMHHFESCERGANSIMCINWFPCHHLFIRLYKYKITRVDRVMIGKMLKAFCGHTRGAAAVEMALISPVVLVIILGIIDFGFLVHNSMQVSSATRSGIQFIMENPTSYSANAATVVQSATNLPSASVSVTTSEGCRCLGSAASVDCSTDTCSGKTPPKYVTVTTTYSHVLILGFPGVPDPWTITRTASIRIPNS
ncbi:MAG: pilus assembly protein [Magnetovibrio sp.]|nr:pilus assembly protein [Magnetovibrio sp.]